MTFLILYAVAAMQPAPGRVFMATHVCPTGAQTHEITAGSLVDDTTINLAGRWGVAVDLGNLDDDPGLEVVCRLSQPAQSDLNITKLVVLDDDLSFVWEDTRGIQGNPEMPSVTLADIDHDGRDDIILPMAETQFNEPPLYKCRIYALDGMTGTVKPGWPFILPGWPEDPYHDSHSEVVAADINDDDTIEIVVQVDDIGSIRKPGAGLYVLKPNGDSIWKYLFYTDTLDRHGAYISPVVCDLDGDHQMEIICHCGWFQRAWPYPLIERRLWIFNSDGTVRRQWQTEGVGAAFSPDYSSPAAADLDGNGDYEIVVVRRPGYVSVFDTAGNMRPGFPVNLTTDARYYQPSAAITRSFSSPSFADLNGDGNLEIIVGSSGRESTNARWAGRVHAFQQDGTSLHGFPVGTRNAIWYSPGAGDVDNDRQPEILTAGCDSAFYAFNSDGSAVPGWPKTGFPTYWLPDVGSYAFLEGIIPLSKTPFLADIDGDSMVEVLMEGKDGQLYTYDESGLMEPSRLPCPTFRFDKERTGWFRGGVSDIVERPGRPPRSLPGQTVVHGVLLMPSASGVEREASGVLLDISGRRAMDLVPGANDLSGIAPGVYFVRSSESSLPVRVVIVK